MRYSDVESFLRPIVGDAPIHPGPSTEAALQKLSSQAIVFATVGGGAGLATEGLFDKPFITIRAIGKQGDYDSAETLAKDIDAAFRALDHNGEVGEAKVLYVTRTGGGPTMIDHDNADRYHFQCTYIAETRA